MHFICMILQHQRVVIILTMVLASNAECLCISLKEAEGGKEKSTSGYTVIACN